MTPVRSAPVRLRDDPAVRALRLLHLPRARLAGAVAAGSGALCCAIALAATSAWLVARAAQRPPVLELSVAIVAVRAFGTGRGVLRYVERLVSHDVALSGVVDLREGVYARLADADPAVAAGLRRGDLLARLGADVDALADLVVRVLLPGAVAAVTAVATTVLAAAVLPAAGAVLALTLLVGGTGSALLAARAARAAHQDAAQARADVAAEVLAVLDGSDELVVAGQLPARRAVLAAAQRRLDAAVERAAAPAAGARALVQVATGAALVGSLAVGVGAHARGQLSSVLLVVVALLPLAAFEGVSLLPAAATALVRCRAAAARVLALVDAAPQQAPAAPCPDLPAPGQGAPGPRLIACGLSVGWPGSRTGPVLSGVDLDVAPGRSLAVLGPSGSGKSTLLATLAGLLPPLAGSAGIGGVPVHGLDDAQRRARVALAAEDGHLFATTLRENLQLSCGPVADEVLVAALTRVGLHPWVAGLAQGLDTVVGPGGTDVSGGQRRRLLVARALLTGAPVLLLDEPTEHLDEQAADALLADLLAAGHDRTVVLATHRRRAAALVDAVLDLGAHPARALTTSPDHERSTRETTRA